MKKSFFVLSAAVLLLLLGEASVRLTRADAHLMKPLLKYHMDYRAQIFQPSVNAELIYELKPNALAGRPGNAGISINDLGLRDTHRARLKPNNTYRIICLGGEFTFGPEVGDNDTFPHQLETLLNKKFKGRFEVWNAGIPNGTFAYQTTAAKLLSAKYAPDLLLFQAGDWGARAFLPYMDLPYYFDRNESLYIENLRFLPFPSARLSRLLLKECALYRFVVVFLNNLVLINTNNPLFNDSGTTEDLLNFSYLSAFYSDRKQPPALILLDWNFNGKITPLTNADSSQSNKRQFNCFTRLPTKASEEYIVAGPPAHVYRWYADCVAEELEKRGYIAKK